MDLTPYPSSSLADSVIPQTLQTYNDLDVDSASLSQMCIYSHFLKEVLPLQRFESIMRATQGALIVASTLQMILGFSGLWRNVVRLSLKGRKQSQTFVFLPQYYLQYHVKFSFCEFIFRFLSPISAVPLVGLVRVWFPRGKVYSRRCHSNTNYQTI